MILQTQARAAILRAHQAAETLVEADDLLRKIVSSAGAGAVDRGALLAVHAVAGRARTWLGRRRPDLRDKDQGATRGGMRGRGSLEPAPSAGALPEAQPERVA